MVRIFAFLFVIFATMLPAHAQGTRNVPLGFCSFTPTVVTNLAAACPVPGGTGYALICAYVQNVNWLDDNTGNAPTSSVGTGGQQIKADNCIPYNGTFTQFRAIQQTGGAIISVTYYRPV